MIQQRLTRNFFKLMTLGFFGLFLIFLLFGDIYGKAVVGFVLFLGSKTPLQKTSFVLKW